MRLAWRTAPSGVAHVVDLDDGRFGWRWTLCRTVYAPPGPEGTQIARSRCELCQRSEVLARWLEDHKEMAT